MAGNGGIRISQRPQASFPFIPDSLDQQLLLYLSRVRLITLERRRKPSLTVLQQSLSDNHRMVSGSVTRPQGETKMPVQIIGQWSALIKRFL